MPLDVANQEHISHLDNSLGEPRNTLRFAFVRQAHGWNGQVGEREREGERGREQTSLQMRRKHHCSRYGNICGNNSCRLEREKSEGRRLQEGRRMKEAQIK